MFDFSKKLDKFIKLSEEQRQKKRRWLSRQNEMVQLEAFILQKKHYFDLSKYKDEDKSLLYYVAHTLAAIEIYDLMQAKKVKNRSQNIFNVHDPTSMRVKNDTTKKPTPVMDRLFNRKAMILKLRYEHGYSYSRIEKYLRDYEGLEASHTQIGKFIKIIEE